MINYVVRPGDTPDTLARRFNTTTDAIIQTNNLSSQAQLFVGQRLVIPAASGPMGPQHQLPVLHPSNRGLLVTAVQQRLQALGYYKKPVDGIYGRGTADAVTAFQLDCGLQATGSVNHATWNALMAKEPCTPGRIFNIATTQNWVLLNDMFTIKKI